MNYLLLIYWDEKLWADLPLPERNRIHQACGAWHDELVKSGHSCGATGLQPAAAATTLRGAGGHAITDGPFAETKETLGGFETLACRDLDEALAIARRFPGLKDGCAVELRPTVAGGACVD
jgi:hypothetical protein